MNKQGESGIPYCDYTWNIVTGCLHGCSYCFARRIAERFSSASKIGETEKDYLSQTNKSYSNNPFPQGFKPTFYPNRLEEPIVRDKPSRIFVSDMGDLFGDWVPKEWIEDVIRMVRQCPQHTFLFLTKNPKRYREFEFPENAWIGASVEDQAAADERIPLLLQTPAAVRFISAEPLLSEINVSRYLKWPICKHWPLGGNPNNYGEYHWAKQALVGKDWVGIDWVIVGGESGPGARPLHPDWVRSLRDQCQAANVPFFFKQWGEYVPEDGAKSCRVCGCTWHNACKGGCPWVEPGLCSNCEGKQVPDYRAVKFLRVGKKKAGRELDGRTWDEMPEVKQ